MVGFICDQKKNEQCLIFFSVKRNMMWPLKRADKSRYMKIVGLKIPRKNIFFWFFKIGILCVALAVLEITL